MNQTCVKKSDPVLLAIRSKGISGAQAMKYKEGYNINEVLAHPNWDCLGRLIEISGQKGTLRFGDSPSSPTTQVVLKDLFDPRKAAEIERKLVWARRS